MLITTGSTGSRTETSRTSLWVTSCYKLVAAAKHQLQQCHVPRLGADKCLAIHGARQPLSTPSVCSGLRVYEMYPTPIKPTRGSLTASQQAWSRRSPQTPEHPTRKPGAPHTMSVKSEAFGRISCCRQGADATAARAAPRMVAWSISWVWAFVGSGLRVQCLGQRLEGV